MNRITKFIKPTTYITKSVKPIIYATKPIKHTTYVAKHTNFANYSTTNRLMYEFKYMEQDSTKNENYKFAELKCEIDSVKSELNHVKDKLDQISDDVKKNNGEIEKNVENSTDVWYLKFGLICLALAHLISK